MIDGTKPNAGGPADRALLWLFPRLGLDRRSRGRRPWTSDHSRSLAIDQWLVCIVVRGLSLSGDRLDLGKIPWDKIPRVGALSCRLHHHPARATRSQDRGARRISSRL